MRDVLLGLAVFAMTVAETLLSTWEARADRQSTSAKHNRFSLKAAHWAAAFEAVLLIEIIMAVQNFWVVVPSAIVGAWIGKYAACERRRRKWRSRVRRRRVAPATPPT